MRQPAKTKTPSRSQIVNTRSLQAPTRGWNSRDPESLTPPGFAHELINLFPTSSKVLLRKGAADWTTGFAAPIKTLMSWAAASGTPSHRLFAATDAGIYDATLSGAVGASVSSITNGKLQWVNFRTTGNSYLVIVNGTDDLRHYQGAAWTTVASFTLSGGGTVNSNTFSGVQVFKRRLFFLERNSLDFCTLPIDSISGNVTRFPLGALFNKGGYLVAMGTWTMDSGSGADDLAVFVTSKGQVAVYKGNDPTSATDWGLVGVYDLPEPLGLNCLHKFGGDLLYLCRTGLFPLSKALQSQDKSSAVSDNIRTAFTNAAAAHGAKFGWQIAIDWPNELLLVNIPTAELTTSVQYVMNTNTKAWAQFMGWDGFCFVYHNGDLYMGMSNKVAKANVGVSDFSQNIVGYCRTSFDYFGARGELKNLNLVRPILELDASVSLEAALDTDFKKETSYGPTSFSALVGSLWGTGVWGTAVWGSGASVRRDWMTLSAYPFYCAALRLRFTTKTATVAWSATDFATENGGVM